MKIGKFSRTRQEMVPKGRKSQKKEPVEPHSFLEALEETSMSHKEVEQSLALLEELSDKLRRSPIFENLVRYKKAVRQFLKKTLQEIYFLEERVFYDSMGSRRVFLIAEQVDAELEMLTRDILHNQAKTLDVARRLDEIRGMILDIYS